MELFYSTEIVVPVYQIFLLLLLSTLALLYGRVKVALIINYLFTLYWGYFLNRDLLYEFFGDLAYFEAVYFGLGLGFIILVMIGLILTEDLTKTD